MKITFKKFEIGWCLEISNFERTNLDHLKYINLENSSWAKGLFKRIDFVKKAATTVRPDIPEGGQEEGKILFLLQIVDLV